MKSPEFSIPLEGEDLLLFLLFFSVLDILATVFLLPDKRSSFFSSGLLDDELHGIDSLPEPRVNGKFHRVYMVLKVLPKSNKLRPGKLNTTSFDAR